MESIYNFNEGLKRIESILGSDDSTANTPIPDLSSIKAGTLYKNVYASLACINYSTENIYYDIRFKVESSFINEAFNICRTNKSFRDMQVIENNIILIYDTRKKSDVDSMTDDISLCLSLPYMLYMKYRNVYGKEMDAKAAIQYKPTTLFAFSDYISDFNKKMQSYRNDIFGVRFKIDEKDLKELKECTSKLKNKEIGVNHGFFKNLDDSHSRMFSLMVETGNGNEMYKCMDGSSKIMNTWILSKI